METVVCRLCGSSDADDYALIPDYLLDRPEVQTRLVKCAQCGLVYQNPRPDMEEMGAHYPPDYEPFLNLTPRKHGLLSFAFEYGWRKRCRFITRHMGKGSILDVGCATGAFLHAMDERGWEVAGVEPDQATAQLARELYGITVFTGTLETAAFPDQSFDVVSMWDVLEHLHEPVATLREINRILKPGGLVVVRVPNLQSWDAALFGDQWVGLDAPRHLQVYSRLTLAQMLALAGFGVIEESTAIGAYVTFVLSVRFAQAAAQCSPRIRKTTERVLYSPIARILSIPLFAIPSMLKRGPELVHIARKA